MRITKMEDTNNINLPDLPKKSGKKTKTKDKPIENQILPRTNRDLVCIYCENEKILNPDQYQALYDLHGSEEKIKDEFFCKPCEMQMKNNPFKFWTIYGNQFKTLLKNLKTTFEIYKTSSHSLEDATALQNMTLSFLKECNIKEPNFEFIIVDKNPIGMTIKSVPFVGDVVLNVYESKNNRIIIR
jgi:hypothetical protein